jgi:serine/threonine-protein kinase
VIERVRPPSPERPARAPSANPIPALAGRLPSANVVPASRPPRPATAGDPAVKPVLPPAPLGLAGKPPARSGPKPRNKSGDEIYIDQVLNNRFKVESKIGEGGFGAVYRGVQLATGRKVALKLLHPEMTKDENLVARFRREGMVLCNLRDAHTITTYDFDQTPDGTLYIAMELLEGKSLHQIFHEEAPLEWKRVFKILVEMCSSLAEAHAQGIVHRDLKPENIYLELRPGNPEFVKILDFGIAKVMRGDTIDPQSPQLTATGQTLGTLEYMSPEQLMGKPLDGRSDVYALGVLAYEMITGRLPFPDAKGPAGLITAQLKQTPIPPSQAQAKATLPKAADRAVLKCLEKDKTNRYPDVSALALALQEVMNSGPSYDLPLASVDMLDPRRSELPSLGPPLLPMVATSPSDPSRGGWVPDGAAGGAGRSSVGSPSDASRGGWVPDGAAGGAGRSPVGSPSDASRGGPVLSTSAPGDSPGMPVERSAGLAAPPLIQRSMHGQVQPPQMQMASTVFAPPPRAPLPPTSLPPTPLPATSYAPAPAATGAGVHAGSTPVGRPNGALPHPQRYPPLPLHSSAVRSSSKLVWWVIALLVVGAGVGTAMALLFSK